MAKSSSTQPAAPVPASLNNDQLRVALPLLEKRIADLQSFFPSGDDEVEAMQAKLNDTVARIYPVGSIEFGRLITRGMASYATVFFAGQDVSFGARRGQIYSAITTALSKFKTEAELIKDRLDEAPESAAVKLLRAYEGLALHPEIERVASSRYRSGHYADAVESAVKALNGLVRLRSGLEMDGSALMQKAFGGENPTLKFNDLADASDKDEQKGFMMMFSGAVAGLRNPRAHGFINDDPERALEFIAFVSLLAKLLDGADE